MPITELIEYEFASDEVRAVYDDIMATRKTDWINNFWKALANHPPTLRRTWESIKQIMGPGALDPLTKEMIYLAVSAANGCDYCIASHTAGARRIPVAEAALIAVLESVLGPVWVWLAIGENPGLPSLVGGAIVLAALAGHTLADLRLEWRAEAAQSVSGSGSRNRPSTGT